METKLLSRRNFIYRLTAAGVAVNIPWWYGNVSAGNVLQTNVRRFHISLQKEAWENNPELLRIMKDAGVTDVWMASYLQGKWYHTPVELKVAADLLRSEGFNAHVLTVPLGHPGNAIDPSDESWSEKKENWKNACDYDGSLYSGTSIHPPVVKDNIEAHKLLAAEGFDTLFLDDDFRLGKYPGKIGGCFCDDCKNDFLQKYDFTANDWETLIESVEKRNPTNVLRSWIKNTCDKEYDMFVALQKATPQMEVGIMVMYLGAEKSGIALDRYHDVPFRVGEMMFGDSSFGKLKGKTDELFSALFHMRFVKPELAYSETTTYPQDALSAKNMAVKLTISLFTDVRNTMFMSGLQPFPVEYWKTLAPAMKKSAQIHKEIAGLKPKGLFKHYWGWDSRLVGEDKPFSLFLATGIPFEVIDEITGDGWTFFSNEDAKGVAEGRVSASEKNLIVRPGLEVKHNSFVTVGENMEELFRFKRDIVKNLKNVPYVEGNIPVVFAWYPSVKKALIWNVNENRQIFKIKYNNKIINSVELEGLDVAIVSTEN